MDRIKKKLYGAVLCLLLTITSFATAIYGEENTIHIFVNGSEVNFQHGKAEVEEGVTLAPIQELLLSMGVEVYLIEDGDIDMIVAESKDFAFAMNVGQKGIYTAYLDENGKVTTEAASTTDMVVREDDVLMYSVRSMADLLGASITWEQRTNTISIWTKEKLKELSEAVQQVPQNSVEESTQERMDILEEQKQKKESDEVQKEEPEDTENKKDVTKQKDNASKQQNEELEVPIVTDEKDQIDAFEQKTEEGILEI